MIFKKLKFGIRSDSSSTNVTIAQNQIYVMSR
jgi:hypothetical protein